MAVRHPLKVVIDNYPAGQEEFVDVANNPEDPSAGTRQVPFSRELFIEHDDFREVPPPKYYRLSPGKEVRLRNAYFVTAKSVVKDAEGNPVLHSPGDYNIAVRGHRDIDFRLPRGSVLSGRVLDQDGEPLVRASIRAMRYRFVQGERRIEPGGSAETDDRGQFRIYGLAPGTYFVSATAQPADAGASGRMVAMSTPVGSVVGNLAADPHTPGSLTYAPTYYPGVPAVSDAAAVTVPIGEEVPGIDFSLQLVTAARVTGMVVGPSGVASNTTVMLVPDDSRGMSGQSYSGRVGRDGSFSISNVPPGRYSARLVVRDAEGRQLTAESDAVEIP